MLFSHQVIRILLVFVAAAAGFSQTVTSSLNGVLIDPTGSTIAGASCTLTNQGTAASQHATSVHDGRFTFPSVLAGTYTLRAESPGFKML